MKEWFREFFRASWIWIILSFLFGLGLGFIYHLYYLILIYLPIVWGCQ